MVELMRKQKIKEDTHMALINSMAVKTPTISSNVIVAVNDLRDRMIAIKEVEYQLRDLKHNLAHEEKLLKKLLIDERMYDLLMVNTNGILKFNKD